MIKFKSNHNNWESCLKHWPTWFKSEDNFIKKCPGIMKYFQSGIVILSKEDYKFSVDGANVQFYNFGTNGIILEWDKEIVKCIPLDDMEKEYELLSYFKNSENPSNTKLL